MKNNEKQASPTRRWLVRGAMVASSAVAGYITLWVAGFSPIWHFGEAEEKPAAPAHIAPLNTPARAERPAEPDVQTAFPGTTSSLSETPRPLILTGTIPGRTLLEGTAFIGIDADNPQTYNGGAVLANGTRLARIHNDHVVLERNGTLAKLFIQGTPRRGNSKPNDLLFVGPTETFTPAKPTPASPLTNFIRPSPVFNGPQLVGFQVHAGRNRTPFSTFGLRPGDVIVALDGVPITDQATALESLRQLTNGVAMVATVRRPNGDEHLPLDGALIVAELERTRNETPNGPHIAALSSQP